MYQESSSVEDAEYHRIMYNYETFKLPHDAGTALKISNVGHDSTASLSGSGTLTTITLSAGDTLVPSCMNNTLPAANVLTNTSLTDGVRLSTPSLSAATPLTGTSITNVLPLTAVSLSAASTPAAAAAMSSGHFSDSSMPNTLTVATMSEVASSSMHTRGDPIAMNHIAHSSEDGVLDGSLVSSSSIDAVVTSMVASSDCQGVVSNNRKFPPQVIAKLLSDEPLNFDMVRIIADQDLESTSHQPQSFNMLGRSGMLVHTKLADNDIVHGSNLNQYRHVEVLNLRPSIKPDNEGATPCSVVWTCAYCNMAFSSSEAVGQHQEKECTENQSIAVATAASSSDDKPIFSPLRQVDDPTYDLKLEKDSHSNKELVKPDMLNIKEDENSTDSEIVWDCISCGKLFFNVDELREHHMTHSVKELSSALMKLSKPQKKAKGIDKANTASLSSTVSIKQDNNDLKSEWNEESTVSSMTKLDEEMADNPGDTPPETPPQDRTMSKLKKKPGPKSVSNEKRKCTKKTGKEGKPPRQRKYKGRAVGQGSRDPHTCHICNKVLSCRGNLAKHLVLHNLDKPFTCNLCGLGFNAKRDQQHHHLQRHTKERPNICDVCGKGYVDRQYLVEHMVFHRQERPHSCDICGKLFLTVKCVRRHKKRHKKDKNFTCAICLKSFAVKADLAAHIRKVHHNDKKSLNLKQQTDSQLKGTHPIQPMQHKQQQPSDNQPIKSKDITEFLLPSGATLPAQLLPADLDPTALSGSVSAKEGIFITADPLTVGSIIPLNDAPDSEYGANVAPLGDHATYVMINSTDEEVATQSVPATHGLNIMYTAATASTQQVNELTRAHISHSGITQGQHMLVESSLGDTTGQLSDGSLHQHIDSQTDLQHQAQETQTLTAVTDSGLEDGHQGDMTVSASSGDHTSEIATATHDHSVVHTSHDPGNGFHLELLSQTIQL